MTQGARHAATKGRDDNMRADTSDITATAGVSRRMTLLGGVATTAAAGFAAGPVFAQAAPTGQVRMAVTIYNNDIALVEDVRTMTLAAGRNKLEFPGVSARIQPQTATLTGPDFDIVEQNFDFDLLTPNKLMEKAVGSKVKIVRTNPATGAETVEEAEVLSVVEGVVLRIGNRIEVLRDDGLPVRVLFDSLPENLRPRPTLSVAVNALRPGARELALRYITSGIGWSADYVGVFDEKAGKLAFQGWVTLTNQTGTSYVNANTQLIAGEPGGGGMDSQWRGGGGGRGMTRAGTGGPGSADTAFSDYHLYTLKLPTTIAQNQTKQVSFVDSQGVSARKLYRINSGGWSSQSQPENAAVKLVFQNSAAGGLGEPLPSGTIRLYQRDSGGRAQFIGEDNIGHTPEGSDLEIKVGDAFDVTSQSTVVSVTAPQEGIAITRMSYRMANAKPEAVTIALQVNVHPTHTFSDVSVKPRQLNATTYLFEVPVPAQGDTTLTFTVREGDPVVADKKKPR
jgi:hypothetical protein